MKKVFLTFMMMVTILAVIGAGLHHGSVSQRPKPKKAPSCGYTIVEYGKGIDCNGDTVKLIREQGIQVLASR
ncbi:hypothetical protein [Pseudochryseolinea flava]|uniref:Uncharacterized protein n=1 Tax=Pseudochryseolinea flava TaxID=2059302 RepID=A0A364Y3F2_9BACT|nr:hypothetical protein [Pseudochryseolinea flava]RAW01405.1 hypothetical protein DQQ10_10915 [Pseudochryseolinea flava]